MLKQTWPSPETLPALFFSEVTASIPTKIISTSDRQVDTTTATVDGDPKAAAAAAGSRTLPRQVRIVVLTISIHPVPRSGDMATQMVWHWYGNLPTNLGAPNNFGQLGECHLHSHCAQPPVSAVRQLHEAILLSFATTLGKASQWFEPIWETFFGDHPPQWHWKWRIQQNHLKPPASKTTARSNFSFIRYQVAASPIINKDATISSPRARNGLRSRSSWGSAFFGGLSTKW